MLIVAQESKELIGLSAGLVRDGFVCSIIPRGNGFLQKIAAQHPNLVIVEMDGRSASSEIQELIQDLKDGSLLPIIALVARETLNSIDGNLDIDDFLISPYDPDDLALRAKRLLHRAKTVDSGELITCDGLVIDPAKCEVTVEHKVVELTFKEYQLLKFLASNKGRVYSREELLNKVWGYDYYGGDRTVDVHVRRIRGKIEDSNHNFIETVRNFGYRFKRDAQLMPLL